MEYVRRPEMYSVLGIIGGSETPDSEFWISLNVKYFLKDVPLYHFWLEDDK